MGAAAAARDAFPPVQIGLTATLTALYAVLCIISFVYLLRMACYRHNVISFQGGFVLLCFVWTLLRVSLFADPYAVWPSWVTNCVYWLPTTLQFATFSLLVAFYVRFKHGADWERVRRRTISIYAFFNLLFLSFFIVWLGLIVAFQNNDDVVNTLTSLRQWFTAFLFIVITVLLAIFGVQLARAAHTNQVLVPLGNRPAASRSRIVVITLVIFLIFASRVVFDILNFADVINVLLYNGRVVGVDSFFVFFVYEIVPTLMVLVFFRQVPKTRLGIGRRETVNDERSLDQTFIGRPRIDTRDNAIRRGAGADDEDPLLMSGASVPVVGKSPWAIWGSSSVVASSYQHALHDSTDTPGDSASSFDAPVTRTYGSTRHA